mmetsp:Transcript_886/g.2763  ORF Transcript_886/g.2763 Transcript_886/m.2763 type:complete len:372 (-) Transcript_886:290-1405(-)
MGLSAAMVVSMGTFHLSRLPPPRSVHTTFTMPCAWLRPLEGAASLEGDTHGRYPPLSPMRNILPRRFPSTYSSAVGENPGTDWAAGEGATGDGPRGLVLSISKCTVRLQLSTTWVSDLAARNSSAKLLRTEPRACGSPSAGSALGWSAGVPATSAAGDATGGPSMTTTGMFARSAAVFFGRGDALRARPPPPFPSRVCCLLKKRSRTSCVPPSAAAMRLREVTTWDRRLRRTASPRDVLRPTFPSRNMLSTSLREKAPFSTWLTGRLKSTPMSRMSRNMRPAATRITKPTKVAMPQCWACWKTFTRVERSQKSMPSRNQRQASRKHGSMASTERCIEPALPRSASAGPTSATRDERTVAAISKSIARTVSV